MPLSIIEEYTTVISPEVRDSVFERDGLVCQYCGTETARNYVTEHILAESRGGPAALFNLVVACQTCNRNKGNKVWIPRNIDQITIEHPEWATKVKYWHKHPDEVPGFVNETTGILVKVPKDLHLGLWIYSRNMRWRHNVRCTMQQVILQAIREFQANHEHDWDKQPIQLTPQVSVTPPQPVTPVIPQHVEALPEIEIAPLDDDSWYSNEGVLAEQLSGVQYLGYEQQYAEMMARHADE